MNSAHEAKMAELKTFFENCKPGVSVWTDWDFDLRAASFRFDGASDGVPTRLLKISVDVLDDQTTANIISGLESRRWDEMLESVPAGTKVIYTSAGFQVAT